jgi:hypothetical protein
MPECDCEYEHSGGQRHRVYTCPDHRTCTCTPTIKPWNCPEHGDANSGIEDAHVR